MSGSDSNVIPTDSTTLIETVHHPVSAELRILVTDTCRLLPVGDVELVYADAVTIGQHSAGGEVLLRQSTGSGASTVTVKLAVPVFPAVSVAVHVIVLIPIGRGVLYAGEQLLEAIDEFDIIFPSLSHTGKELKLSQLCEDPSHKVTDEFIPE